LIRKIGVAVAGSRASKLHAEARVDEKSPSHWLNYDCARGRSTRVHVPAATGGARAHVNKCIVIPCAAQLCSLERRALLLSLWSLMVVVGSMRGSAVAGVIPVGFGLS